MKRMLSPVRTAFTVGLTLALASCSSMRPQQPPSPTAAMPTIYTFESDANGFNTKNFFYDNGEEVVVFDTQFTPELAQKSIDYVRTKTKNPITHVVITHPNPDKFNGASVFQAIGANVIASAATAEAMPDVHAYKKYYFVNIAKSFTEETYPAQGTVDTTFQTHYELRLKNGDTVLLRVLGKPGVSSNQTVAFIPSVRALMVGDLVHHKAHAWLEGGIVKGKPMPNIDGWIADLEELTSLYNNDASITIYGGRGEATNLPAAVDEQIRYLRRANETVDLYIEHLGEQKKELQGDSAQMHYQRLQGEFEKAFPDYRLGYMIGYGIYGLVNAKL